MQRAPLPLVVLDGATHVVRRGNLAFAHLVGRNMAQCIGRPLAKLLSKKPRCFALLDRVRRTGKAETFTDEEPTHPHPSFWAYTAWTGAADHKLVHLMIQVSATTAFHRQTAAVNEALVLGSIRQHELTEVAEKLNVKLNEGINERRRINSLLRLLWDAGSVLLAISDPDEMLRELLGKIGPIMGLDTYFNYLVDENGTALRLVSCSGVSPKVARSIKRLEFGGTISGAVAEHHRSIYVPRVQLSRDPRAKVIKSFGLRAYHCSPLMANGTLLGTLGFGSRTRDELDAGERAVLQTISYYVAVVHERLRVAQALRLSEIRYRRQFEAAHDGVLLIDPTTHKITDANPFISKLLGYPHEALVGRELFEIGLLKDKTASQKMFRSIHRQREVRYDDLPMRNSSGHEKEVEVVANLYSENGHPVIQCNVRDIMERKLTEAALRASEIRYRTLFEVGPVAVYSCDAEGRIQNYNQRAVELWGRQPVRNAANERFCGSLRMFRPNGRLLRHARCPMAEVLSGKIDAARDAEVVIERPDGSRLSCIVNIRPLKNEDGKITGAINCFYDITERKRTAEAERRTAELSTANEVANREIVHRLAIEVALRESDQLQRGLVTESRGLHTQLRHLTRDLLTAQEDERRKISRELHDDVMQTLVGINVGLSALTQGATVSPAALKSNIARTQRLVKNSLQAVHRFARELRPSVLDDFGLVPALQTYAKELAARKGLRLRLTATGDLDTIDSIPRTTLFRVAQEALSNVARHANARAVRIRLIRLVGSVRLEVQDNGKSFEVQATLAPGKNKRLGLLGMRERVEMIGGTLVITSSPGRGTLVRAELPLHAKPNS